MRKKIGLALTTILTLAALQWAVASVETKPAATQVQEEAVKTCPDKSKCPMSDPAKCPDPGKAQTSESHCPFSDTKS